MWLAAENNIILLYTPYPVAKRVRRETNNYCSTQLYNTSN